VPGYGVQFPRDEGSHPDFRLEWWYVTGWLTDGLDQPLGFQITFFRARPWRSANPSAFAPHHLLIAHAAISDPRHGRLRHDQRAARIAFDLAGAAEGRTNVWIDDWSLRQEHERYTATIAGRGFRLDLVCSATQPPLLQGAAGYSQKGPRPESASYYYSVPQLAVTGTITREGSTGSGRGTAWLDHEWSSSYMDERAVGWDWIGINFDDGAALMAFQMRDAKGAPFWAGGAFRNAVGDVRTFERAEVRFIPLRRWRSPRTGALYPVSWRVQTGEREIDVECLLEDQENDTRATTGAVYWEGAVRALLAGRQIGRGYLELTGYLRRLQL
jgi:predicted secreted hydrolase